MVLETKPMLGQQIKNPSEIPGRSKSIALVLSGIAALIACSQTIGWVFNHPDILQLWPGNALMSFNTAVLVLLAAVGISSLLWNQTERISLGLGFILGLISFTSFTKSA